MDSYEATSVVFAKIRSLEPENASKIMGHLLIQDLGEKDLIRLAFGPETLLHSLILKAKAHLGLSANFSSALAASFPPMPRNPISRPTSNNPPFSESSPAIVHKTDFNNSPTSSPSSSHFLSLSRFPNNNISPKSVPFLPRDNIAAGSFPMSPFSHHKNGNLDTTCASDLIDENQINEYLPFLNDSSSSRNEDLIDPHYHRRSYSASDVCFGSENGSLGTCYKPCVYFAKGFCKNGNSCKFVHCGFGDSVDASGSIVGSPSKFDEFMRLKEAQLMAGVSPSRYNNYLNILQHQNEVQRNAAAAALMTEEELHNLGLCRNERHDFLAMAAAEKRNSASRQIYLTFPADSDFKDGDVRDYFSKFGPVDDVRIPYQQKRMFGFVTFVYPETVKLILAKGNPHFICDSRVLVKPYKEKGKVPDKRQQQQPQWGEFSPCLSPSMPDNREPHDLNLGMPTGAGMMYDAQSMLLRRKLDEQIELQHAIELQGRRLMNLHLPDLKNGRIHHHRHSLSLCSPLPTESHDHINQSVILRHYLNQNVAEFNAIDGHDNSQEASISISSQQKLEREANPVFVQSNTSGKSKKEESADHEQTDVERSVEQVLPEILFASPEKAAVDQQAEFCTNNEVSPNNPSLPLTCASDFSYL